MPQPGWFENLGAIKRVLKPCVLLIFDLSLTTRRSLTREQRLARAFVLPGVTPCEDLDGLSARAEKMPEQSGFTRSGGFAIETSQNLGEYFAIFYNIIREA
jgi:hypothetical protein